MASKISETHQSSPVSVYFITHVMQVGIGFLSFQQILTKYAQQDAWIALLICGLSALGIMWIILRLLENEASYGTADIFSIHHRLFGRWIGGLLNYLVLFHVLLFAVVFLRSYIEILQVWVFPHLSIVCFSVIFCLIVWYVVIGGMRSITGVCLLSFIYLLPLFLSSIFIAPQAHFESILPLFDHSPQSILHSSFQAVHNFLGFELIIYYYPFIKKPKEARKWAYFGMLTTLQLYFTLLILGILYFSNGALQNTIWPTITFWKSVHFPLLEHIDTICIIILLWNLIPNISLCSWSIARGIKATFPAIKMKHSLIGILIVIIIFCVFIKDGLEVKQINDLYNFYGFFLIYLYFPFLLAAQWIKKKWGKNWHEA
ncbi:MAG: GerAB/ArcD/ProY family transporter [Sporolactobacillus sp.]